MSEYSKLQLERIRAKDNLITVYKQRIDELERQTRIMAGEISTHKDWSDKHPEEVLEAFEAIAQQEKNR